MDTAELTLPEGAAAPIAPSALTEAKPWRLAPAKPEMNPQQRVISSAYLVMFALVVAFLVVVGLVAWLGA
jgi:hypothetical protein